jgi:hypothetical protein
LGKGNKLGKVCPTPARLPIKLKLTKAKANLILWDMAHPSTFCIEEIHCSERSAIPAEQRQLCHLVIR